MPGEIQELNCVITPTHQHKRIDTFLREFYKTNSRTYFQRLIEEGLVLVNGKPIKKSYKPEVNDEIEVQLALTPELDLIPQDIPLDIIYEDQDMLAINKPAGMIVHPGHGNTSGTFANALLFYCKTLETDGSLRPGIVHRLDKDTSGVLLAAKSLQMHQGLSRLFANRQIQKKYLVICVGKLPRQGTIHAPIGRHPVYRKKMAVLQEGGKEAISHYRTISTSKNFSLAEIDIETGRTHQIRVHLKHIGCPVAGDSLYGNDSINRLYGIKRQLLHCQTLNFTHPLSKQLLEITAPLPDDMMSALKKFGLSANSESN